MEITGTLKNARRVAVGNGMTVLTGEIYNDSKKRFCDGWAIRTSYIVSKDGDVFRTRNSVYKVETWA